MYALISFSHKKLDISLREKVAFPQDEIPRLYKSLLETCLKIQECIILSTCNRFEILLYGEELSIEDMNDLIELIAKKEELNQKCSKSVQMFFFREKQLSIFLRLQVVWIALLLEKLKSQGNLRGLLKLLMS